jgi:hypothetical protein
MFEEFKNWSYSNLGQWHYVVGYFLVLFSHNWPLLLAMAMAVVQAVRAFRQPSRLQLCWLYAWVCLGVAYEYDKHIAVRFHAACDFIFIGELFPLNGPAHAVVGPGVTIALYATAPLLLSYWAWSMIRAGQAQPIAELERPSLNL